MATPVSHPNQSQSNRSKSLGYSRGHFSQSLDIHSQSQGHSNQSHDFPNQSQNNSSQSQIYYIQSHDLNQTSDPVSQSPIGIRAIPAILGAYRGRFIPYQPVSRSSHHILRPLQSVTGPSQTALGPTLHVNGWNGTETS